MMTEKTDKLREFYIIVIVFECFRLPSHKTYHSHKNRAYPFFLSESFCPNNACPRYDYSDITMTMQEGQLWLLPPENSNRTA